MTTKTLLSITLATTLGLTTVALADAHKEPTRTPSKKMDPKPMPPVPSGPPAEVAALAKAMGGTWKCTGKAAMDPSNPTKMSDIKMTMSMKLDLGKYWISGTLKSKQFDGVSYTTWDAGTSKWYRVMVDNMGGSETAWSTGIKDNKAVWLGEGRGMGMNGFKTRTTEVMTGAKAMTLTGEMSMDGKNWMTGWEASCKR